MRVIAMIPFQTVIAKAVLVILSLTLLTTVSFAQISPKFFRMHVNSLSNPWPPTVNVQFADFNTHDSAGTSWAELNPKAGTYNWTKLDKYISRALQYGNPIMFDFYYTPSWASAKPSGSCVRGSDGGCYPPNDLQADGTGTDQHVKTFIAALLQHVGQGKIKYIEIWNEFNISTEWSGTIAQLVRITKDVRAVAKSYDSSVLISSPAETGDGSGSLYMNWLGKFLAAGGGAYVDTFGLHGHVTQPENIIKRTNNALSMMAQHGQGGKPLFDTEGSWVLKQGLASGMQRGFLFREYLATLSTPTKGFYVYAFDIGAKLWNSSTAQLTANGRAYQRFYSWLVRSTMTSKCQPESSGSSTWSCTFTMADGTKAMAIWNTAVTYPNTVTVSVPSTYIKYLTLGGSSYAIDATHKVSIGYEPIFLEN